MSDQNTPPQDDDAPLPGTAEAQPEKKRRRWPVLTLVIALVMSLGLNLALGGFIAGRLSGGGDPAMAVHENLRRIARTMDEADRKVMRAAFVDRAGEFRQLRRDRRPLMREVRQALRAEPFDPAALETALAGVQQHLVRASTVFQTALIDAANNVSPEARKKLAGLRMPGS